MQYKHLAMIMGVMITATSVGSTATVFAEESKTESTQDAGDTTEDIAETSDEDAEKKNDDTEQTKENEILGEVKSVEDGKITIAVGTRKEMAHPGEQPQGEENGEAPEKPEGEAPDGNGDGQGTPDGEAPSMLDLTGEEQEITVTDSTVITKQSMGGGQGASGGEAPEKPEGEAPDSNGQAPDSQGASDVAGQTEEITLDDIKEGDVVAITLDDDGNAATITVQSMDMGGGQGGPGGQASGVDSYDAANEYSSDETVSDTTLESTGTDENAALVSYGAEVTFSNDAISRTSSDSQGGGTMVVDGGTYTSNGVGSPAVYCTADIAVNNAELTANGSEAVCIEGLNSLRLYNSNLTGNMSDDEQNDTTWTVILYQSMSGDSEVGNSTFQMDGGTITSKNGGLFYTTNTECTITLKDVDITYNDDNEFFLQCTGNNNQRGWGQSGANGSDCNFTADSQDMKGNVIWDSISDLDFYMTNGSTLEGAFVNDESNAGNGGDGYCNVVIDKDSTWTVTGDSIITSLSNAGTITDADGKTVSIVGTDGTTYVEGDSDYTITVGSYQDSADTFVSTTVDDWSSYEVERPESL